MSSSSGGPDDAPSASDSFRPRLPGPRPEASEIGRLLADLLVAMNAPGDEAQARYEEVLAQLRERAEDAVVEIARADDCDEGDYARRWALIYAAGQLQREAALPYLRSVILTPIPPERAPDPHGFSTVIEETILRTTAIEGVELLAAQGRSAALELLFTAVEQPSLSMRRAAVQGVLAARDGEQWRSRLSELLPQEQQFLLDVRRVDVRDVPQIRDPREHLADGAGQDPSEPAPLLPEDRDDTGGPPGGDGPKLPPS